MDAFTKKLLASLVAIVMIASVFTAFVMTGTVAAQPPTCPLDEDFSSWLPDGWATDDWDLSDSNHAGGTSPEARLNWVYISGNYSYLDSKPVDTNGLPSLTLEFKSFIDDYCCSEGYYFADPSCYGACPSYTCKVYTRANGSDSWTDVTPWSNPITGNVDPNTYSVDINSDIGNATQVRFEFDGFGYAIDNWYVDDVKICSTPVNYRFKYLHAKGGWMNITDPVGTQWQELRPFFGREYYLSSWNDTGGNGVLSRCDWIDLSRNPGGAGGHYHVEEVTITLNVTPVDVDVGEPMYIELEGGYDMDILTNPVCTHWHEIYPTFCQQYHLTGWNDTGPNGKLDPCDYIYLEWSGMPTTICPLDEDFSGGSFPPGGWATDDWDWWYSSYAGGTPPEAWLSSYWAISGNYSYLDSKPVDTTGALNLTLEFKSFIWDYCGAYGGLYNCSVYTRAHGGDGWTDVTPWTNPITGNISANNYSIPISSDIGPATQVRFELDGLWMCLEHWFVDDVRICYQPWWHVEDVAIDIVVTPKPPPVGGEAYPVSKVSVLAPWIALGVVLAGGTSWYVLRRRRAKS